MFKKTIFSEIYEAQSASDGPTVMILGGVHGDEEPGIHVIQWMLSDDFGLQYPLKCGRLIIAIGNPKAVQLRKRFFQVDLNRQYTTDSSVFQHSPSYENVRVAELKGFMKDCDFVLDLHSTSYPIPPFSASANTSEHIAICKQFGLEYITVNWAGMTDGEASDEWVDRMTNAIGVTIECGQDEDDVAKDFAKQVVLSFLTDLNMIEAQHTLRPHSAPKVIEVYGEIRKLSNDFHYLEEPEEFQCIKKGTHYAQDGDISFVAEEDFILLMPAKKIEDHIQIAFKGRAL